MEKSANSKDNPEESFVVHTRNGQEFVGTRHNAGLVRFDGETAIYNHAFIDHSERGRRLFFEQLAPDIYRAFERHSKEHNFTMSSCSEEPAPAIIEIFEEQFCKIIDDEQRELPTE